MENNIYFDAVNLLIQINRAHKKMIDSGVCSRIGIHRTQHIILMHLAGRGVTPSQKEIAEHLGITPAAVTGALQKLESDGYITRSIGNDNRYNEITLTDMGRKVVSETKLLFSDIDAGMFTGFSDEDLSAFISSLEKIQNNINNFGGKETV